MKDDVSTQDDYFLSSTPTTSPAVVTANTLPFAVYVDKGCCCCCCCNMPLTAAKKCITRGKRVHVRAWLIS